MKKEIQKNSEIKLIGLSVRTNNAQEMNPETSKMPGLVSEFFSKGLAASIPNRKNPGVTLCCYTEYDNDANGDYLYFVGEEVAALDTIPEGFKGLSVPASNYAKFTTDEGQMPFVVLSAWQKIWQMQAEDLGGARTFKADFEVYDQRAMDPSKTTVDLYIGIE